MQRITNKQLDNLATWINELTNSPITPYRRDENDRLVANVGNYHIYHAYGGVELHRMANEAGGIRVVINSGCTTKRDLYNLMHAYIKGLMTEKESIAA